MHSLGEIQAFVGAVRAAPTLTDIGLTLGEAARRLAFDHFALVQTGSGGRPIGPVRVSDYPDPWVEALGRADLIRDDPVLLAAQRQVAPFEWEGLPRLMPLSDRQHAYMARAASAGLGGGYTVPLHVPGDASGLCSFVTAAGRPVRSEVLPMAQYLACFAFEAARRLYDASARQPMLSQREIDCLVLVARGKSDWVAGRLLGLSETTVHKYVENAKRRYGVGTRTEAVVRALYDGQLAFRDVIG